MLGWLRVAVARASCSKRAMRSGVCRQQFGQDLDRDLAMQTGVPGAVDLPHAAFAKFVEDAVRAEFLPDHVRVCGIIRCQVSQPGTPAVVCCLTGLKRCRQFREIAAKIPTERPARGLLRDRLVDLSVMSDMHSPTRILAIEPDPQGADVLSRVLDKGVGADVMVVQNVDAALTSIAEHVPDLILTSTFLPPAALAQLIDDLRRRPDATHTQIITTPHFLDAPNGDPSHDGSERILRFPRQRKGVGRFHCDPATLRTEVAQYLEQALTLRAAARNRQHAGVAVTDLVPAGRALDPWQPASGASSLRIPTAQDLRALNSLRPADRRRAFRRRAADLAGQWGLRLGSHGDASILDISSSGVRLETSTRLNPGSLIDLEVIGMEGSLPVSARLVRAEMVDSDGPEVKYRAAAMFLREIDVFATHGNPLLVAAAAAESHTPKVLADLLGRVLADASWVSNGAKLRSLFETEVRALVRARDVRIRAVPMRTVGGCQSLYFSIPTATAPKHGLHVVFERGYRPTAAEFRLLKAAASLAAVVLDLDPGGEAPSPKN
jgi:CheY-like chemotaxis protein